jgi:hypothetical protein
MEPSRTTSTRYARPHRPAPVRWANGLGAALAKLGLKADLSPGKLLAEAERRNRLSDFGDGSFLEPMRLLLEAVEAEARLHPIGRLITRERLLGVLGNRLRAERLFRDHPEILEAELAPPIVVTGLQRTGTTLLHRLLAADPETRAVASWEAVNPAPFRGRDPRRKIAERSERALRYLAPDFFAIHPVEADAPEEDSILLDFSFLSPVAEATLRVPSYSRWLQAQDLAPAYRYLVRLLRLLAWQRAPRARAAASLKERAPTRFVLKTPAHLPYLDLLVDALPGARIVHTHRDPAATLPSYCSMIAHGRGIFSDAIDPVEIGDELLRLQSRMLLRALELRQSSPSLHARILDLEYRELCSDPLATVERIYDFAGVPFSDGARTAVGAALRANRKDRFGKHRYALADFGLDPERVATAFGPYVESRAPRSGLPLEGIPPLATTGRDGPGLEAN